MWNSIILDMCLDLTSIHCVALDKCLDLSEPQLPCLEHRDPCAYLVEFP